MDSRKLYETLVKMGVEMNNHETDLYLKATDRVLSLLHEYDYKENVTYFTSNIDGELWLDVPFAYIPEWDRKMRVRR